jgi:hypothetical protein
MPHSRAPTGTVPWRSGGGSSCPRLSEPLARVRALDRTAASAAAPSRRPAAWPHLNSGLVDDAVDALDLMSDESGFHWFPIPKLEHQLVNLRHIQYHTAQLADRLRAAEDVGIRWIGARRPDNA